MTPMKLPVQIRFGLTGILLLVGLAVTGPWVTPYAPDAVDLHSIARSPSAVHWLGTDELGRDLLSRLLSAARISLMIGFLSALGAGLIGVTVGGVAGFCRSEEHTSE